MKSPIFAFAMGAAVGSLTAWIIAKRYYEQIAQEEIDSVKEVFSKKKIPSYEGPNDSDEAAAMEAAQRNHDKPSVMEYAEKLRGMGYTDYSTQKKEEKEEPALVKGDRPYVIPPLEFGEYEDYAQISLKYYADCVVADDQDEIVENIEETIGVESLTHFGEYEEDAVYVRNDARKCDYEILRVLDRYEDFLIENPHKAEV